MKINVAVLSGDGIGPEVMKQGVAVLRAVAQRFHHETICVEALCGAHAIDEVGDPFPQETLRVCQEADVVLFGSVGDPKYDNDPTAKVRPEQGLLAMRKQLGLYANIRPIATFSSLLHLSPLKEEVLTGADFVCVRELTGGCISAQKKNHLSTHKRTQKMLLTLTTTLVQRWSAYCTWPISMPCNERNISP